MAAAADHQSVQLGQVRAVIWDLDGTLYEDTHHFDYYADRLAEALPPERRQAFHEAYRLARDGGHALRVGTLYDTVRDRILTVRGGAVVEVRTWAGEVLAPEVWREDYPAPVAVDHQRLYNVGDVWWLCAACAAHFGLSREETLAAFLATREYMTRPEFRLSPVPGLAETLAALRRAGVVQVLATNSPRPDSEILLEKLGLAGAFDLCFFETYKPAGMARVLSALTEKYGIPVTAVLGVGDNYLNDLDPIARAGGQTIFIDPHGVGSQGPCTCRVQRVADVVRLLQLGASRR
ncbi:MAG: HAD family hydrolase [Bacillota bacterium]